MQPAPGALRSGISKVDGAESASAVPVSSVGSHICAPVLTLKKHSVPWHIHNLRWGMMYVVVENLGRGNEEAHGACFIANLYGATGWTKSYQGCVTYPTWYAILCIQ